MDSNYVFLCGVMWCKFGQKDAGKELLRAADSGDPDLKALAWAMFAKGVRRLKELEKRMQPSSRAILAEGYVDEIMRCLYGTFAQPPVVRFRALSMRMDWVDRLEVERGWESGRQKGIRCRRLSWQK